MNHKNLYHTTPNYETKAKLHLGVAGKIIRWDDVRGFGFVATQSPKAEIFFHIKKVQAREIMPKVGESVTVRAQYDEEKQRWTATEITSTQREHAAQAQQKSDHALFRPMKDKLQWAVPLVCVWLLGLLAVAWQLAAMFASISCIAIALYAWDKHCALHKRSRIPENSLHAVALLGGWVGVLLARYLFRHKTQKQPFVGIFWATVILNIALTGYFIFSGSLNRLF